MIDSVLSALKGQVTGELQQKADVAPNQLDDVFGVVKDAAMGTVGQQMASGGLDAVMNLFSNKSNSTSANTLQSGLTSSIVSGLIEKLGFDSGKSSMIATIVVPALINLITKKNSETPDDDASPLKDMFSGGLGGAAGSMLGGLFK